MIQQRGKTVQVQKVSKKHAPKVQPWNKVPMVREQSFLASVKEIIDYSDEIDVTRIGLIGAMMSGKSTLSRTIAHAIHKYSKTPFTVKIFYKEDLKNFKETVSKLEPANYIMIFDDVSFLKSSTSSQGISTIESEVSTIRHIGDDPTQTIDVKIILIFNFHYPKALPPFLREFEFKYITTIGTDSERVMGENYGADNVDLVKNFKSMRKRAVTKKVWFENVGNDRPPLMYKWRDPFQPVLFWNETNMRKIVSPTRFFIDENCSICNEAEGNTQYNEGELVQILEEGKKLCGIAPFLAAVRITAKLHGINVYSREYERALKWFARERNTRNMPLSAVLKILNLEPKRVHLTTPEAEIEESS